jgi:hypothetical protein
MHGPLIFFSANGCLRGGLRRREIPVLSFSLVVMLARNYFLHLSETHFLREKPILFSLIQFGNISACNTSKLKHPQLVRTSMAASEDAINVNIDITKYASTVRANVINHAVNT